MASDDELRYAFGVPRPAGGYRAVPERQRSSEEVYDAPQQHPGDYSFVRSLHDLWSKQWRAASSPVSFMDIFGAAPSRQGGPSSVDPTTRSGLENWSALFTPGPGGRGGKFKGELTPRQKQLMDSLGNVGGGGRFDEPVLETLQQMGVPEDAIDYLRNNVRSEHYLHPQGAVPAAPRITKVAREKSPDLTEMLDAFGHVSGHPMKALEGSLVNREMPAWEELAMLESKLGLGKSEWPHWVSGKSTLNLFDPNREKMSTEPNPYGRSGALDASERETFHGMRHELSDDQKIQLAMIIATILRRQQGGSYGKLGEPGAN